MGFKWGAGSPSGLEFVRGVHQFRGSLVLLVIEWRTAGGLQFLFFKGLLLILAKVLPWGL